MANKLGYRDGGKTSEEGINRITSRLLVNAGVLTEDALEVTEAGSPDNTVVVAVGDIAIGDNSPSATAPAYYYHGWVDSAHAETVSANASGNPRIDVIVAFVDLTVVDDTNSDNPGALDFMIVAGTPAATPAAPDDAAIQAAVGASNPWVALAQIDVANGFSSITDSDITDLRPMAFTPQRVAGDTSIDLVGAGLLWSQDSGLIGQMTSGYALIGKTSVTKGYLKHTFTASKDTYVDLAIGDKPTSVDDLTYTEVSNGAAAPALAADSIRLAKVVTDGSGITGVTTSGVDSNGVPIRPTKNVATHTHANDAEGGNTLTTPSIGDFTNSVHDHEDAAGGGMLGAAALVENAIGHGYVEIGRTTLGSAGDSLNVDSLPAKKYLRVLVSLLGNGNKTAHFRYNNDSGNNYSQVTSIDFGAASNSTWQPYHILRGGTYNVLFAVMDIVNESNENKRTIAHLLDTNDSGAGNAPTGVEGFFKWVNNSQISRIEFINLGTDDYAIGSQIIVFGKD